MKLSWTGRLAVAISAVSLVVLLPDANQSVHALGGTDVDPAFAAAGSLLLMILSGWLLTGVAVSFLAARVTAFRRVARTITPTFLRKALFLGAAGALVVGPVWASDAADHDVQSPHVVTAVSVLDGLRLPDRPISSAPTLTPARPNHAVHADTESHIVAPGDTLWAIAAATLVPHATTGEIVHAVNQWHAANHNVIGADPNRLFPGQKLNPPA